MHRPVLWEPALQTREANGKKEIPACGEAGVAAGAWPFGRCPDSAADFDIRPCWAATR